MSQFFASFSIMPSLVAQTGKRLPAMQETRPRSLGWEDPLEKEMAAHSSIAWKIPWTAEPGRLPSMGVAKSWTGLSDFTFTLPMNIQGLVFLDVVGKPSGCRASSPGSGSSSAGTKDAVPLSPGSP